MLMYLKRAGDEMRLLLPLADAEDQTMKSSVRLQVLYGKGEGGGAMGHEAEDGCGG